MSLFQRTVKTRFCILSDTHNQAPKTESSTQYAYRQPLPTADVLLHAGDLTMTGRVMEYQQIIDMLAAADAELKIVIAGNHDITLDESFYKSIGKTLYHPNSPENVDEVKEMWTGTKARQAGIIYLEEGTRTFILNNGAKLTIYTSQHQPKFGVWAFNYHRNTDRFNPTLGVGRIKASNPVPSWPEVDIMLTHGPPYGILDTTWTGEEVGCQHLHQAVQRCRPRLHCFGHIHEGWGAERMNWSTRNSEKLRIDQTLVLEQRSAYLDLTESGRSPLKYGDETVFVNAAIMDKSYRPKNAPWVIDLDLPILQQPKDPVAEHEC